MSADDQGGAGRREVAYRVFAAEYDDADLSYSESDEERAPNYLVLPTGARVNRLFVVGVLTEVEAASEEVLRARIVDPTGAFVVYAGQYQPDALAFLEKADPPAFVALTGKARTFQPDDSDVTYTSVRPESVNEVDAETRDRWTVQCARQTVERVGTAARALTYPEGSDALRERLESGGVDVGLAAGIPLALDHYGTTATYLEAVRTMAVQATEVVAGERDEVDPIEVSPAATGAVDAASLAASAIETGHPAGVTAVPGASSETSAGTDSGTVLSGDSETASSDATTGGTVGESDTVREDATTDDSAGDDELEDFEPGEFDLDEEVREEVEQEYGTDFQSGTEVDGPGEAGIETPEPEAEADAPAAEVAGSAGDSPSGSSGGESPDEAEPSADADHETGPVAASESGGRPEPGDGSEVEPEPEPGDVDVEDAVMEAMRDSDDGEGTAKSAIVDAVVERHGVAENAVEAAIQDALMDGRCYEPEDDVFRPI